MNFKNPEKMCIPVKTHIHFFIDIKNDTRFLQVSKMIVDFLYVDMFEKKSPKYISLNMW